LELIEDEDEHAHEQNQKLHRDFDERAHQQRGAPFAD
jgi:hypothetical protein